VRVAVVLAAVAFAAMLGEVQSAPDAQVSPTSTPGPYPIRNIIVVMMENASFDTLFGTYFQVNPAANGLQVWTPQPGGTPTPLPQVNLTRTPYATLPVPTAYTSAFPNPVPNGPLLLGSTSGGPLNWATTLSVDPSHVFYRNQYQIDRNPITGIGRNDQFLVWDSINGNSVATQVPNAGALVMGYWNLNGSNLWNWARSYTLADNYFQGAFGGSWLNHMWLACACAGLWNPQPAPAISQAQQFVDLPGFYQDNNSDVRGEPNNSAIVNTSQPPFNFLPPNYPQGGPTVPPLAQVAFGGTTTPTIVPAQHIGNLLSSRNISWAYFSEGYIQPATYPLPYVDTNHLPFNQFPTPGAMPVGGPNLQDLSVLRQALATGMNVPQVSFVMPGTSNSMHPGEGSVQAGDVWLGPVPTPGAPTPTGTPGILTSIRNSPIWPNTAVILTWDENGGFYDHVSPPVVDQWGPGSRVPALIISPFSTGGQIDKTQYDHTSILKFIEAVFGLPALGGERASMGNLLNAFQFPTATLTPTLTRTPVPTSLTVAQAQAQAPGTAGFQRGPAGAGCAGVGQTCNVGGAVSGTVSVIGSFTFALTGTVPAGVPAGITPVAVFSTTQGVLGAACGAASVAAGTAYTCTGTVTAPGAVPLQGSTAALCFTAGAACLLGTVSGPGVAATVAVASAPLLPPLVIPPAPPPPLVPPVPLTVGAPFMAPFAGPGAVAEVPVIPEAEGGLLLALGLAAVGLLARWRRS
jgi:phospholipase C